MNFFNSSLGAGGFNLSAGSKNPNKANKTKDKTQSQGAVTITTNPNVQQVQPTNPYPAFAAYIPYNVPTYQPGMAARFDPFTGQPIGPHYAFVTPQAPNTPQFNPQYNPHVPVTPDQGIRIDVNLGDDKKKKKKNDDSSSDEECKKCDYEQKKEKYRGKNTDKFWKYFNLAMDSRHNCGKFG